VKSDKFRAVLALEDGSVWRGRGFGASAKVQGEVVFNTGMVGYPESITDPSYHSQILCQTFPLIGNYGINPESFESPKPQVAGYVVGEICERPSHPTSTKSLHEWLRENGIPGIEGIDTRSLTKRLRTYGVMRGILSAGEEAINSRLLAEEAQTIPDPNARDLVSEVTARRIEILNRDAKTVIVLIDCGAKDNIVRCLLRRNVSVCRVPADADFKTIMSLAPNGVVISNGPGDPKRCPATIRTIKRLLTQNLPIFGICLGNQILALAAGADTFKLKFGHRSQNQPCLEEGTAKCYITSQNHGYAVDPLSLPRGWRPLFTNANDHTNEGIIHLRKPFMSVQFHPEACPGPTDTEFLFDRFLEKVR
jgi:carbamoyl-phosphate synthase small subunit